MLAVGPSFGLSSLCLQCSLCIALPRIKMCVFHIVQLVYVPHVILWG